MFHIVNTESAIQQIETIAREIWHQHFTSQIGIEQVEYMLRKFQSIEAVSRQINEENYSYYLVKEADEILGYFAFHPAAKHLYLSKFYLKQSARGRGIAKKMLTFIEKETTIRNLNAVQLNVYKGNNDTINIYKKMGFEIIDQPKIDIGNGFILDDYVMRKDISQI